MKIRITGTEDECNQARRYYLSLEHSVKTKYVQASSLYPNRGSSTLFRIYIDIEFNSEITYGVTGLLKDKNYE